ncbi:CotH kinase family protein [bacterium]|nr:CotH kinase family protein [bacterium]
MKIGKVAVATLIIVLVIIHAVSAVELRSYYVECDADEFEYILNHPLEERYIDCTFSYNDSAWQDVRIRLRGESSREYPKKSYKVNFNSDKRFYGRDKLNLAGEWTDTSYCREFFSYDLYRRAGLPAAGALFTQLYVNQNYMGLYLDVEQIDECFLDYTDLPDNAVIYKADVAGCLLKPTDRFDLVWSKKNYVETGFYDLLNLIEWIDTTPNEWFFNELSKYFDPDELARVIAVNSLLANSSTYYHNYYLVRDIDEDGLWHILPWDMDYTFYYQYDYSLPHYQRSGHIDLGGNALIKACWRNHQMQNLIFDNIRGLIDSVFTEDYYQAMSDTLNDLLYDAVDADTLKSRTTQAFESGLAMFPEYVVGRSRMILEKMNSYALPFDLNTAIQTPDGIYFSWDSTYIADNTDFSYGIIYSTDKRFYSNNHYIRDIQGTSILYNQFEPGRYYWRVYAIAEHDGRIYCNTYFSPFTITEGMFDKTEVTGTINQSTSWTRENSPYSLPEGLTIAPDAVLTIESGVIVGIGDGQDILVEGGLRVFGAKDDSVRFMSLNPDENWGSIVIDHPTDPIQFRYTAISHGSEYLISVHGGNVEIFDSSIRHGYRAIRATSTNLHVERTRFEDFNQEMFHADSGNVIIRSSSFAYGATTGDRGDLIDCNFVNNLELTNCKLFANVDDGLDLDDVVSAVITGNRISRAFDKGISIHGNRSDIYIANNIITDCGIGISAQAMTGVQLYNNVIAFNDTGFWVGVSNNHGEVFVRNTILWRNGIQITGYEGVEPDVAYCLVQGDEDYPGEGNHRRNANFVDQWGMNFELRDDSPLIDAGWGTGHPEKDFFYAARVDDPNTENTGAGEITYVDIGAFEYGSVSVVKEIDIQPEEYSLLRNYPNSFNNATRIDFSVTRGIGARLEIFDLSGRRIFSRYLEDARPGNHSILWDGRSDNGVSLSSGVYLCRVSQETETDVIKMVLMK